MSLAIVHSQTLFGVQSLPVQVEVHITNGLPNFSIVGLAETAVKESRDRVRSAIISSQFEFPLRKIVVNLAPADLPKEGGRFDLPIALGILIASGQLSGKALTDVEYLGELSLGGELKRIPGAISAIQNTKNSGHQMVLPADNHFDAALCNSASSSSTAFLAKNFLEVCYWIEGKTELEAPYQNNDNSVYLLPTQIPDLKDVKAQSHARRALEIAAAGQHNLLFFGPPGTGKSMLASRLPGISPTMTSDELLETAAIHSLNTNLSESGRSAYVRPFRSPHHSASAAAIVGGGSRPKPGEISLAHNGILFLDELPEFSRHALEMLREPMESGEISISRARSRLTFPANFQLLAAMNPCPCGYFQDGTQRCECPPSRITAYRKKISGPLLDRIDLHIMVNTIPLEELDAAPEGESSALVQQRVQRCRNLQLDRQQKCNARLAGEKLKKHCHLSKNTKNYLHKALNALHLSARAHDRCLRVARTIADMAQEENISSEHIAEALGYRQLSR